MARDRIALAIQASELEIRAQQQWSVLIDACVEKLYRGPVSTLEDRADKRRLLAVLLDRSVLPAMVRLWRNSAFMPADMREAAGETDESYTRCSLGRRLKDMAKASGERGYEDTFVKRSARFVDAMAAFGLVEIDETRVNRKPITVTPALHGLLEAYFYVRSFEWEAALDADTDATDAAPGEEGKE